MKLKKLILAVLATVILVYSMSILRRNTPNEQRAKRDFLAEYPTYSVERIAVDQEEVIEVTFRIYYRVPGDSALHEKIQGYNLVDGKWLVSHKIKP